MVPISVSVAPTMASVIRKQYVNDARHPMNVNVSLNGERSEQYVKRLLLPRR
jgi:hypothetical protein